MKTSTRSVGRPSALLKYPRGTFTVQDLYKLNAGSNKKNPKVCVLTVRKHIENGVASKFLTQVKTAVTGKVGKPANQYIRTAVKTGLEAARATRETTNTTAIPVNVEITAPVVAEVTATAPAETVAATVNPMA